MTDIAFRLPETVEIGAQGGPMFQTTMIELHGGGEHRNADWPASRGEWRLGYAIQDKADLAAVIALFYAAQGRFSTFRFKDWPDFELARQVIGETDTATAAFQIYKRYVPVMGASHDKTLRRIVSGTVSVWVNDVSISAGAGAGQYQIDLDTGIVTLGATLVAQDETDVEVACEFDRPVRFDMDKLEITARGTDLAAIPDIRIVEVLD